MNGLIILLIAISAISVILILLYLCEKSSPSASIVLAQIDAAYAELDPRNFLTLPDEQKDDCLVWAFGKDWEDIKWSCRDDRFRDLHPELDPNDFAGHTAMGIFWERLERAYCAAKKRDIKEDN